MSYTDKTVRFDFDDHRKQEISETLKVVYANIRRKRVQSD